MFAAWLCLLLLLMFAGLLMFAALLKSHDFLIMFYSLLKRLMISKCELANVNVGFFMNTGKPFLHKTVRNILLISMSVVATFS
jgi:hypothetical protein